MVGIEVGSGVIVELYLSDVRGNTVLLCRMPNQNGVVVYSGNDRRRIRRNNIESDSYN